MKAKTKNQSALDFRLMSQTYKIQDIDILKEVGIKTGFHVPDYGCGPDDLNNAGEILW
jgi:hypothetical protein